jgi:hypothetical protein
MSRSNCFAFWSSSTSSDGSPATSLTSSFLFVQAQSFPCLGVRILFHQFALGTDDEVVQVHPLNFLAQTLSDLVAQFALASGSVLLLQLRDQFHATGKQLLGQRLTRRPRCRFRVLKNSRFWQ